MELFEKCNKFLPKVMEVKNKGIYPYFIPIDSQPDHDVYIDGKKLIMLGSNNYLGLTTHEKVKKAAEDAIRKYGTSCTGSRFLNGTLDIHINLEKALATFFKKDEAIVFSTGYQANLGVISSLVQKGDFVITDKLDHASIIDGCMLSMGQMKRFKHNNIESLELVLKEIDKDAGKLVVIDGIFSMEGDIAKLDKIVETAHKYNARVMVDDAHSVGVLGETGAGTAEHFNLTEKVDLIMGTFSKSFASLGGFVVGDSYVIEYIRHNARSLIFSASMSPPSVAAAHASLNIIKSEPERRKKLWENALYMLNELKSAGFDTGLSETPIIPIYVRDDIKTFIFWKKLMKEGIFVNPVLPPAVPPNGSLLRTSYMATHERDELEKAFKVIKNVGKELKII